MIRISLIGMALVAITVFLHAIGTSVWVRHVAAKYARDPSMLSLERSFLILTSTALVAIFLHAVQIFIWAKAYMTLLPAGELQNIEEAVYFSFVTFTTLGYGDITLSDSWRILSGIEALNGILLVGWSVAMLFAVVQRTWQSMSTHGHKE
jgi:voltage-gated potassium channel